MTEVALNATKKTKKRETYWLFILCWEFLLLKKNISVIKLSICGNTKPPLSGI